MYREYQRRTEDLHPQYSYEKNDFDEKDHDLYLTAMFRLLPNRRKTDKDNRYEI